MEWLDSKIIWAVLSSIFTGGLAVGWAKRDGQALSNDVTMNDKRVREEIAAENMRTKDQFARLEKDIDSLEDHRLRADNRLTKIESDSAHTRRTVDTIGNDVKTIMTQVTQVATAIVTRKND